MSSQRTRILALLLIAVLSLVVVFHALVLARIVPYTIVWGSRIRNEEDLLVFELVSISINMVMIGVLAVYSGLLRLNTKPMLIRVSLWLMAGLFALNTVGNLFSNNDFERMIFTPVTLLLSIACAYLALQYNRV